MTTKEDLEEAMPHAEEHISQCWRLANAPGADRPYWLEKMDHYLDMWIMGRDQLRALSELAGL